MSERHIITILFTNIVLVILFSGCFSSLHQGQITDGYSATFALRPLPHEFMYNYGSLGPAWGANDTRASIAVRREKAPLKKGELGYFVGVVADISISPEVIETHPQINHFPFTFRGSYYYQLPKNSIIDIGIGGEYGIWPPVFPLIPYAVLGRNFGDRFALYGEVRSFWNSSPSSLWDSSDRVPTIGAKFDVSKDISLYTEMSFFPKLISCKYWESSEEGEQIECEYGKTFTPAIGLGITFRDWDKKLFKKSPVLDDNGNLITEEEIRANIRSKGYGEGWLLGGCLGCLGSVWIMYASLLLPESSHVRDNVAEFFIGFGIPAATLTGSIVGYLIDVNRERRQAIETIKAKRQQQKNRVCKLFCVNDL